MNSQNYISFAIVSGFFIGLISAFLTFDAPESIIFFTLLVTAVFYLIAISTSSLFCWFIDFQNKTFNKCQMEENLEYYVDQFKKREEELSKVLAYIKKIELEDINKEQPNQ